MLWFLINKEITRKGNQHGHYDNKMTDQKLYYEIMNVKKNNFLHTIKISGFFVQAAYEWESDTNFFYKELKKYFIRLW